MNGNGRGDESMKIIDIAHMIETLGEKQKEQAERIEEIGADSKARASKSLGAVFGLVFLLLLPAIGAIWQGGRLIERIDSMAQSMREIGHDHEGRLRALERK